MSLQDNFGNPQGLLGRLMLSGMNMGHTSMAKWGFTQFTVPQTGAMADIGCGGGYNLRRLLAASRSGKVYGVDISPVSVEKSKAANQKELGKRCEVYQGSAQALPFEAQSLELVTAFETVYFWPALPDCFREILRVLKPGGQFVVINDPGDPDRHWENLVANMTVYSPEEISSFMEQAGFSDIRVTRNRNTYCVVGGKEGKKKE